jgi:site-specific DNA-methyltransferase (adenine-specific)
MITTGLMTSLTDQWATPQNLFDDLDAKHNFTLDVCASSWNHKCERYFDIETDGLLQDWKQEVCWMNPPYGRSIGLWMRKAFEASQLGATVVCLVPARTDTAWWHDYAIKGEIDFIRGRVKFVSPEGRSDPAPFPSAIVTFQSTVFRGKTQ